MKSRDKNSQSSDDLSQFEQTAKFFAVETIDLIEKIEAFPKYVSRQALAKFFAKYEIFKKVLQVNGSIVECGCLHGAGTLAWAKMLALSQRIIHAKYLHLILLKVFHP